MRKNRMYQIELPDENKEYTGKYFIEKRNTNNIYYVSYKSNDNSVYYTLYGGYKKLGNAERKLWDICKNIPYVKHYYCSIELLDKYITSVYDF